MAGIRGTPEKSTLGRYETFWGYLFIAAPMLGFLFFSAMPIVGSLFVSLTRWDLVTSPQWIGLDNWAEALSLNISPTPQEVDEETGELLFRCGRETVLQSQLGDYANATDLRGRPVTCEPRLTLASDVLPAGYETWFEYDAGGQHYVVGARDPIFWQSLFNMVFFLLGIPISLGLALLLALALNQQIAGARFFRTVFYIPTVLSVVAISLIWIWILNPEFGLLNTTLRSLGLTQIGGTNWLQDANTVKPAIMLVGIWKGVGYQMIIFLAGLQGIPRQLYEAAEIDGASAWGKFRFVTWPGLTPTTFFLLITAMIGSFQLFIEPQIMTRGGPYFQSTTPVMIIWQNGFRDLQMGYAATQAWILGAIIMVLTVINFSLSRRWVFYD